MERKPVHALVPRVVLREELTARRAAYGARTRGKRREGKDRDGYEQEHQLPHRTRRVPLRGETTGGRPNDHRNSRRSLHRPADPGVPVPPTVARTAARRGRSTVGSAARSGQGARTTRPLGPEAVLELAQVVQQERVGRPPRARQDAALAEPLKPLRAAAEAGVDAASPPSRI